MLLLVFGTRPEAIKLGPVAAELRALGVPFATLCTGQHTDLLRGTPAESDLAGGTSLGLASSGNIVKYLRTAEMKLREYLEARPDYEVVVVQGDTMSALAAARAATIQERLLVHVEAGVRSGDVNNPWPEEDTRKEISQLADWHYAATPTAFANLLAEGVRHERIRLTGNPVVSALARYTSAKPVPPEPHILITMHRREWLRSADVKPVIDALERAAAEHPRVAFVWPVHPTVRKFFEGRVELGSPLLTGPPQPYERMALVLASSMGVITDSGGLQEESATLGVPCAVLRFATDRPESVEAGVARLFEPTATGVAAAVETFASGGVLRRLSAWFGSGDREAFAASLLAEFM